MNKEISPSIITITKVDDQYHLRKLITTLRSVSETTDPNSYLEYIVVKSGKLDFSLPEFAGKIRNFRLVQNPDPTAKWSSQRNLGIREARGNYIVFVDDGMRLEKGWLDALKDEIEKTDVAAVSGAVLPESSKTIWGKCQGLLLHPGGGYQLFAQGKHEINFFHTGIFIAKKEVLEEFMFDETLNFGCEDMDLSIRIKKKYPWKKFIFTPSALAYHHTRDSIFEIFEWMRRYGRGRMQIFKKHKIPMTDFFIHKFFLFIAICISSSIISLFLPLLLCSIFYILYFFKLSKKILDLKAKIKTIELSNAVNFPVLLFIPFVFWTMNIAFDIGRIQEAILNFRRIRDD